MIGELEKAYPNLRYNLVRPFVKNISPNAISFLAFIFGVAAGLSFYYGYFVVAAIMILLNGYFDILDGAIAKRYGATRYGDFLDHSLDRIADVAIFLGITMNPIMPQGIGYLTIIMILLVSYLGTEAQALTKKRMYGGLACRADRLIIIAAAAFLAYFNRYMIFWGTLLILILAVITFVQRFAAIKNELA